ncbi:DGQHR domain-containing protein DpdB [Micromonospora halotolerans]|uniref:DGQHR domain-containing protein DpdB n=1 Tax=Micromonospora halotolerans TaxID=709879 RepID=A0ABZ0A0C9_9ACTN|nr:DGQHR domain-containing protein DpdB [Micromonospora halotolerans]WNM40908.1 DGQHR domain-containing protein DpdB [Micromonospora halotolerans]
MTTVTKQGDESAVAASSGKVLHLPALEIRQGPNRRLYTFAVDGKQVPSFAAVSRVRRDSQQQLHGYQRPEVLAHVAAIRRYVESDDRPLLPNAIVVAFDDRVRFLPADTASDGPGYVRMGTLVVPVSEDWEDADKPGFIVDGQQRCAAIRDAEVPAFPICVTAFITADQADHRSQFILVNSTKPLPKGLIHELLPAASGPLPNQLRVRQLPATVLERLNFEERSPLRHMIQTPTNPAGVIKDNSMLRMLENSISNGVLYRFRGSDGTLPNIGLMVTVLSDFWTAVREVFGENAWGKPPRKSRLMHGAGIISMGYLMDAIADTNSSGEEFPDVQGFAAGLKTVKDYCRWTEGTWDLGDGIPRRWNDVQNTPRDIQRITDFLVSTYYAKQGKRHERSSRLF